tara:strand:- start:1906 stop:2100 length:195 start_codon:yes stop_codon:yes gene_type:complete
MSDNITGQEGVKAGIEAVAQSISKPHAIKLVRCQLNCSLQTAKNLIEYVTRTYPHSNDHWEKKE